MQATSDAGLNPFFNQQIDCRDGLDNVEAQTFKNVVLVGAVRLTKGGEYAT